MDDFWKRIYDLIQTPLPQPKQLELDRLFEMLRSVPAPKVGELPVAPEWVQRYARERGLLPEQQAPQHSTLMGLRNMLINQDPTMSHTQGIPNVYRGELQPDFESGNSLPEAYDRTRGVRT